MEGWKVGVVLKWVKRVAEEGGWLLLFLVVTAGFSLRQGFVYHHLVCNHLFDKPPWVTVFP
jgi:hypothetical protein